MDIEECEPPHNPIDFRFNNCSSNYCIENFDDGIDLGMDFTACKFFNSFLNLLQTIDLAESKHLNIYKKS